MFGNAQQTIVLDALLDVAGYHCLADDGIPERRLAVVAASEAAEHFVAMCDDVVRLVADQDIDDVLRLEAFLDGIDDFEHQQELVASFHSFARMEAIVALAAVLGLVLLSEVMQEELASADGRLGVCCRLLQQLPTDILLCNGFALHELLELAQVVRREESEADAFSAVSASSACLLIIAFEALGNVVVDDVADVGFVDAHTKSNGSNDDVDALHEEVVLCLCPIDRLHSCMISACLDVVGSQHFREFLYTTTAQAIDDAALTLIL